MKYIDFHWGFICFTIPILVSMQWRNQDIRAGGPKMKDIEMKEGEHGVLLSKFFLELRIAQTFIMIKEHVQLKW